MRAAVAYAAVLGAFSSGLAVAATGADSSRGAQPETVVVDAAVRRQRIDGFGTTERVWSDPHLSKSPVTDVPPRAQRAILTALYKRLGLTRVRPFLDQGIEFREGGPFNFAGKLGDAHIAFVKQAIPFGLRTVFPAPVYFEDSVNENNVGAYVDFAMGVLTHWRSRGYTPRLFSPINEQQISHTLSDEWMHKMVLQMGARMSAAGLPTKLVIPDDENPNDAYRRALAVLADPDARKYVAAIAFHIYKGSASDWPRLRALASNYRLPLWMTEYWSPDYTSWPGVLGWARNVNDLLTAGVNAVDYLWGFFGDWAAGSAGAYISISFDNGKYRSYTLNPLYYVMGQYSRFVRPGDVRIAAAAPTGVPTTAFLGRNRIVIVSINHGGSPVLVRYRVRGTGVRGRAQVVRSSAAERWRVLAPARLSASGFSARLAPQSITTFLLRGKR